MKKEEQDLRAQKEKQAIWGMPSFVLPAPELSREEIRFAEEFLAPESVGHRFALGRNEYSSRLARSVEIAGFVDDFADRDAVWQGKQVCHSKDLPETSMVINCSMCCWPVTVDSKLKKLKIRGDLPLGRLLYADPTLMKKPRFMAYTIRDLASNATHWQNLYERLGDDESKRVLRDVMSYRVSGDISFMSHYSVRPRDHYFEEFLMLGSDEVFVDGGGFDGDTTEEFCRRCPDYNAVHLFEPSGSNLWKAKIRLQNSEKIMLHQEGLADVEGLAFFNPDAGSACAFSESGSNKIRVTTIDARIKEKVSIIKMDLEGWELRALTGARQHILQDHPKLAIAVYHDPSHFWQVFEYVMALRSDYRVYIRHYTEGWSETVMYFVPQED